MKRFIALFVLPAVLLLTFQLGCNNTTDDDKSKDQTEQNEDMGHSHGTGDALVWPKEGVEHEGFKISLGHHGNHFHGRDKIEPAAVVMKDDKDVGDASMTCQLMDGDNAIGEPVAMVFEPKTEAEPAHYAGAKLTFPKEEKTYLIQFAMTLPGVEESFTETVEVKCGH